MPILTGQWPDVYGNLDVEWGEEYETLERVGEKLLKRKDEKRKTGKSSSAEFYDLARDKDEGRPFHEQDPIQGFAITWEQAGVGTSITLTHEDFLFEQTLEMGDKVRGLARSVGLRKEHDIAMRLKEGDQLTYTNISGKVVSLAIANTKALIATDHPNPAVAANTDSNDMAAAPFNKSNLKDALNRFRKFRSDKGLKIVGLNPKAIVTSDSEEMAMAVDEVIQSKLDPDTGTNKVNPMSNRGFVHIQIPNFLTDTNGVLDETDEYIWFLADLPRTEFFMKQAEEAAPVFPKFPTADPNLPITGDHKVTVRGTYALFIRRYHWIVGSFAASV